MTSLFRTYHIENAHTKQPARPIERGVRTYSDTGLAKMDLKNTHHQPNLQMPGLKTDPPINSASTATG